MKNKIMLMHLFYFIFVALLLLPFKDISNSMGARKIVLAIPSVMLNNAGFMAVALFIGVCYYFFLSENFGKKDAAFLVLAELATFLAVVFLYEIVFLIKGIPFDRVLTRIMIMFIYGFITLSLLGLVFHGLEVAKCKVFSKKP